MTPVPISDVLPSAAGSGDQLLQRGRRMDGSLGKRATIGFALTLAVLVASAGITCWKTQQLVTEEHGWRRTQAVVAELESLLSTLTHAETCQRGYLLTSEDRYQTA